MSDRVAWSLVAVLVLGVATYFVAPLVRDPPELRQWTGLVREEPREAVDTLQLSAWAHPPADAREHDLARCRDALAPAHFEIQRAGVEATGTADHSMPCETALGWLARGDRSAAWWAPARDLTARQCCSAQFKRIASLVVDRCRAVGIPDPPLAPPAKQYDRAFRDDDPLLREEPPSKAKH